MELNNDYYIVAKRGEEYKFTSLYIITKDKWRLAYSVDRICVYHCLSRSCNDFTKEDLTILTKGEYEDNIYWKSSAMKTALSKLFNGAAIKPNSDDKEVEEDKQQDASYVILKRKDSHNYIYVSKATWLSYYPMLKIRDHMVIHQLGSYPDALKENLVPLKDYELVTDSSCGPMTKKLILTGLNITEGEVDFSESLMHEKGTSQKPHQQPAVVKVDHEVKRRFFKYKNGSAYYHAITPALDTLKGDMIHIAHMKHDNVYHARIGDLIEVEYESIPAEYTDPYIKGQKTTEQKQSQTTNSIEQSKTNNMSTTNGKKGMMGNMMEMMMLSQMMGGQMGGNTAGGPFGNMNPMMLMMMSKGEENGGKSGLSGMMGGLNLEFGQYENPGEKLALSFSGVAVKRQDGTYVTYDRANRQLIEVGDMTFDAEFYKIPTQKPVVGDLIILDNTIYMVEEVRDNGEIRCICPTTGSKATKIKRNNIFGMYFYTKIVSMFDMMAGGENNPFGNMFGQQPAPVAPAGSPMNPYSYGQQSESKQSFKNVPAEDTPMQYFAFDNANEMEEFRKWKNSKSAEKSPAKRAYKKRTPKATPGAGDQK